MFAGNRKVVHVEVIVRLIEERRDRVDLAEFEELEAEVDDLARDRIRVERERPPMSDGLEDRIAEAFPRRCHHDQVARRVGVMNVEAVRAFVAVAEEGLLAWEEISDASPMLKSSPSVSWKKRSDVCAASWSGYNRSGKF